MARYLVSSGIQSHDHVQMTVNGHAGPGESNVRSNEKMGTFKPIDVSLPHSQRMLAVRTKVTPTGSPVHDVLIPTYGVGKLEQACELGPSNEHGCPYVTRSC